MTFRLSGRSAEFAWSVPVALVIAFACGDPEPSQPTMTCEPADAPVAVLSPTPTTGTLSVRSDMGESTPSTSPTQTSIPTHIPTLSATPEALDGVGIGIELTQTYRDEELGFSISYPQNWFPSEFDDSVEFGLVHSRPCAFHLRFLIHLCPATSGRRKGS